MPSLRLLPGLLGLITLPLAAVEVSGVRFVDEVAVGERTLAVRGAGLLRVKWVIKAYCAACYVDAAAAGADPLSDVARRLELHYFHDIKAKDFVAATNATIGNNCTADELAGMHDAIAAYNALYVDIKDGERYALTYVPGVGTELSHNGKPLGTIPGVVFARALFAIWLGANPLDAGLRRALTGTPP